MNQAASHIRYIYIYKGRVAASNPERVSARTDSLSMLRIRSEALLTAYLRMNYMNSMRAR